MQESKLIGLIDPPGRYAPEDAMARISGAHAELAAGRPTGAGGIGAGEARPGPEPGSFPAIGGFFRARLSVEMPAQLIVEPILG
jgi:hypothetical protein